ncbi:DUF411 domain-containing protein [Azohydromonas aeria]|uniref:DUF411 domain-containing protein n=1 Tax=Azohydromonas aeria TaxID=2590212 RepID=UPI0012FA17CE|nr:DUF411 domain-containing protein [Azohydromonas aeria]
MKTQRRRLLLALAVLHVGPLAHAAGAPLVEVWKSPTCGCCKDWITHLEANGFRTKVHDSGNNAMRSRVGIDVKYGSCHTALIGGYALEGHVPAREIQRLLKERPAAIGLAVPGMPVGSPGMDGPDYGGQKDPYDVLLLRKDGTALTYQTYR